MALINIDNNKCNLSYSCVRICPVNAIKVEAHMDYPEVMHNACIGCGHCLKVCSPGAIEWIDDPQIVRILAGLAGALFGEDRMVWKLVANGGRDDPVGLVVGLGDDI